MRPIFFRNLDAVPVGHDDGAGAANRTFLKVIAKSQWEPTWWWSTIDNLALAQDHQLPESAPVVSTKNDASAIQKICNADGFRSVISLTYNCGADAELMIAAKASSQCTGIYMISRRAVPGRYRCECRFTRSMTS